MQVWQLPTNTMRCYISHLGNDIYHHNVGFLLCARAKAFVHQLVEYVRRSGPSAAGRHASFNKSSVPSVMLSDAYTPRVSSGTCLCTDFCVKLMNNSPSLIHWCTSHVNHRRDMNIDFLFIHCLIMFHSMRAFVFAGSRWCRIVNLIRLHYNACSCSSDRFVCKYFNIQNFRPL